VREHLADYYAMITHLDAQIGVVLKELEKSGKYENTIIILAGDNGLALGQHGLFGKQNCYEHSVRVPLIFAGPGIPKDRRSSALCYLLDIYPTICDMLGLDKPATVEGQSLVSCMRQQAGAGREYLYLAYTEFIRGLRDDRYKLIEYNVDGNRTVQLFDLENDPFEIKNIACEPASQQVLEKLKAKLREFSFQWDDRGSKWGKKFWQEA
jgi:arylsulfatase A-like enzyme